MQCTTCTRKALYTVSAFQSYADGRGVDSTHACREHLADTIDFLTVRYPDRRIIPVRLPLEPLDGEEPNRA